YGGKQNEMPGDRSDYAACVRTVRRLPKHRRTAAVMAGLGGARRQYLLPDPRDENSLTPPAQRPGLGSQESEPQGAGAPAAPPRKVIGHYSNGLLTRMSV